MSIESARTADFDFSQCFTGVVFPGDCFDPLYAVFEDPIFPSNVSPVIRLSYFVSGFPCP